MTIRTLLPWAAAALSLWAAASAAALTTSAAPAIDIVDDRGAHVTLPQPPRRIVSLVPSLTETVCALQACDRLVGTDRYSDWPVSVRALPKLGGLDDAHIEAIVALKPDVVLLANSPRVVERLESLGVRVLVLIPDSFVDARRTATSVGRVLGDEAAGVALWRGVESRIADAARQVPPALRGRRVYVEIASAPFAAGEASFVGAVIERLGLANVVPAALGPFPQLNPEFVLRAQPEIVIASARELAGMPARPGWSRLKALKEGRTCGLAPAAWNALVRPGPRLAEAAEAIADCLRRLPAGEQTVERTTGRTTERTFQHAAQAAAVGR